MHRLSSNLKLIRKQRWRMSQDRFAQLLNSTRSKINSYENGGVEPSIAFILSLEKLTSISVRELFYGPIDVDQIPPFPLEDGKSFEFEKNRKSQELKKSELVDILELQNSNKQILSQIDGKINQIKDFLKLDQ